MIIVQLLKRHCAVLAIIVAVVGLHSDNVFAVSVSATLNKIKDQPMTQSLGFDKSTRQLKEGDTLLLPLSGSQISEFTVTKNKPSASGGNIVNATSHNGSNLLLSSDQKATYGSITGNGMNYTISHDSRLGTILVDQNHAEFPLIDLGEDGIIPPGKLANVPGIEQMAPEQKASLKLMQELNTPQISSNGSSIRMLILYSNEFAAGFSSATARINQLLSFTNQSMENSNIDLEFTLARAQVLNFDNNLGTSTILTQVRTGAGAFSGVASLRNEVGADMVAVLSFQPGFSSNGVAYINGDDPNFAFSSTRLSPGCCDSVFAHELGHNMGSGHEHRAANPNGNFSPCGFNFTGYSCGHGNPVVGWGTIMSNQPLSSAAVNRVFSNPNISCLGQPCGVPEGQSNPADNFRSFNISRLLVANFRQDPVPPVVPPTTPNGEVSIPAIVPLLLDDED